MNTDRKIIFWAQGSGLANRLRALIGYQALAKFKKRSFFLCWISDGGCDALFSELFHTDNVQQISDSKLEAEKDNEQVRIYSDCCWFKDIWEKHLHESVPWESFKSEALNFAEQLNPLPRIAYRIENFTGHNKLTNMPGFHIRMTDNLKAYNGWLGHSGFNLEHISTLNGFEIQIQKVLSEKVSNGIFLATDNKKIERYFKNRFPGQILTYQKIWRSRSRLNFSFVFRRNNFRIKQRTSNMEDALVEMYLLSKCKFITGTYFSSYSKFAAILGKKPYFEILGDQSKKNEFIDGLLKKIND